MEKKEPESRFLRVRCSKCRNEQIIFSNAASTIDCLVCGKPLARPTGGRAEVDGQILETLN